MRSPGLRIRALAPILFACSVWTPAQNAWLFPGYGPVIHHSATVGGNACSKDVQIRVVRCYPGADAFVQIQNCLNALPDPGGTCDATSIQGPQKISNILNITRPASVLFGDAVFTYGGGSVLIRINARGVQLIGKGRGYDSGRSFGGRNHSRVLCR